MTTWLDKINAINVPKSEGANSPFYEALLDFKSAMEAKFPQLRIDIRTRREVSVLIIHDLVTSPRWRRDRDSLMLSIFDRITSAETTFKRTELKGKEELLNELADFATTTQFPVTLSIYEKDCSEPVEGWLRFRGNGSMSSEDVPVLVSPAVQQEIARAAESSLEQSLVFGVSLIADKKLADRYIASLQYLDLCSGGYVVEVQSHEAKGNNQIEITGKMTPISKSI